jgi:RHS repeat-associated protein
LFNGNIGSIELFNGDINIGKHYRYDQLNRIKGSKEFDLDYSAVNNGPNQNYKYQTSISNNSTQYSYDRNGNITDLMRLDGETNQTMDNLEYSYKSGTDQLDYVKDLVTDNNLFPNDVDNQSIGNYDYDAIGNLTKDVAEGISNITWTPSGKVASIERGSQPTKARPMLNFEYDGMGNRVKKVVTFVEGGRNFYKSTYYVRDAQGNLMATYDERDCNSSNEEENYYRFSKSFGSYSHQTSASVGINVLLGFLINNGNNLFSKSSELLNSAASCLLTSPTIRSTIFQQMVLSDYFVSQPLAYQRVLNYSPYFYANNAFLNSHNAFYNAVNDKQEVWLMHLIRNPSFIPAFYNSIEPNFSAIPSIDKNQSVGEIFNHHKILLSTLVNSDPTLFIDLLQIDPSDLQMMVDAMSDPNTAQVILGVLLDELLNNHFDPQVDDVNLEVGLKKLNALLYVASLNSSELLQVLDQHMSLLQLMQDSYQMGWIANPSTSYDLLAAILRHIETNDYGVIDLSLIPDYNPMDAVKWNEDVSGQFLTDFIVTDIAPPIMHSTSANYFSGFNSNVYTLYFGQSSTVRSYVLDAMNRNWNTAVFKNTILAQVNDTKINLEQTETTTQLLNYFKNKFPLKLMQQNYLKDTLNCALLGVQSYSPFEYVEELNAEFGLVLITPCPTADVYLTPVSYDVYGSARLGTIDAKIRRKDNANTFSRKLRAKTYELTDHLGNVMVTISDKKLHPLEYQDSSSNFASYYNDGFKADVTGRYDRYPFGMEIASRSGDFKLEDYTKNHYKTVFYGLLNDCDDYSYNSYQAEAFETCETDLNPFDQPIVTGYNINCYGPFYINLSMSLNEILPNLEPNALYEFTIMVTQSSGRIITASMDTASIVVTAPGATTTAAINASATKYVKYYYLGSHLTTLAGSNNKVDLRINVANGAGPFSPSTTISDISINEVSFGINTPIALRNGAAYRYSFNGAERDDELKGSGNSLDFGDRIYDPRLGRWMSVDPLFKIYPEISPYAYCANNPIRYKEVDGRGFNGGFSVENQSSKPIVVVGTSKTITTDANGNKVENESPATEVTLQPGERLEVYYTKTKDKSGNVTEKYTAKVVTANDGKVVKGKEDVNAWDVDYIKVQKGQTFEDSDGNTYNTDPNDKTAKTPNPPTGEGTIKVRPSVFDYNPDKDDANEGKVIIKDGSNGNLNVKTGGEWENEPSVNYGDGKKK